MGLFKRVLRRVLSTAGLIRTPCGYKKQYKRIEVSYAGIKAGHYKRHFGGGAAQWVRRGQYQLALLRALGLQPGDVFIDVGCGPLRAGCHLVRFLKPHCYFGIDLNQSFVDAAHFLISRDGLQDQQPTVVRADNFDFDRLDLPRPPDWIFAFSVLNHCSIAERRTFFAEVDKVAGPGTRILVSHRHWWKPADLEGTRVRVVRKIGPGDLAKIGLPPISESGWSRKQTPLPMMEFTACSRAG